VLTSKLEDGTSIGRDTGPHVSTFLGAGTSNGGTLHLTLVVNNDASVILEVNVGTLLSSPGLSLADHNARVDLLSQLGLTLLASTHDQVTNGGTWESVLSTLNTTNGDNHKRLGASVVAAIEHSSDRQTLKEQKLLIFITIMIW
jgi:hypothetical protein